MLEHIFQAKLIKELNILFPNCIILKNDANYIQGFPDLLLLYKNNWAALECKGSSNFRFQPNQEYYVKHLNDMSFAAVVYPENKEEILNELQSAFKSNRSTRLSRRK